MKIGQRSIEQDSKSKPGLYQLTTERSDVPGTPSIHGDNTVGRGVMRPKLGPSFYNYNPERDDRDVKV